MPIPKQSDHLEITEAFQQDFGEFSLEKLWSHPDLKPFKEKKNREILLFELAGKSFFVKRYYGPAVGHFHYLLGGLSDKFGPENEWQKANLLKDVGIRAVEPVAFGIERRYGILKRAIVVTLGMEGHRLEDFLHEEIDPDNRTRVVKELAVFAGRFHALGLSHQDFYLCHLFWTPACEEIGLIDLQRVRRSRTPDGKPRLGRIVKDLAQLDYSARTTLASDDYHRLKKTFVSTYAKHVPLISVPRVMSKIHRKVARIARHDRKKKARES